MDTATRTLSSRIALFLCLIVAAAILGSQRSAPADQRPLIIYGATAAEERVIDWSIRRYREAGLDGMPDLEVYLHRSDAECRGGIGYYLSGRIDLCTKDSSEPYQRKFALHEMAHGWIEANVDAATLDRFMDDPRDRRLERPELRLEATGYRAGRRDHRPGGSAKARSHRCSPRSPTHRRSRRLYELLTGRQPITPAAR